MQITDATKERLQCYLILKGLGPYHQSKVVEEAINFFLDSKGFPTRESLP